MPFTAEDARRCRRDFPSLRRDVGGQPAAFLDGPAGTQVPRAVIDAVAGSYRTANANTEGRFATSQESDRRIAATRRTVAAFLGAAGPETISFGQNMTSLAYALSHAFARLFHPGDEVVVTQLDHEANRSPWIALGEMGVVVREAEMTAEGRLDLEDLAGKVGPRTRLVAAGWASNALGTVNDVARIGEIAHSVDAWFLADGVHYAPHFPIDVAAVDADFLLCSAYKFYGPHVGILYARPGLLEELPVDRLACHTTAAPERIETGTLDHAALCGVGAAIEYLASLGAGVDLREKLVSAMTDLAAYEHELAAHYARGLAGIRGVAVWGPPFDDGPRAPTVSITLEGVPAPDLAEALGEQGIFVWDGHFYAPRPVEVLGLAAQGGLLRTGISLYNTEEEVDRLLAALEALAGVLP